MLGLSHLLQGDLLAAAEAWRQMPSSPWSISWLTVADILAGRDEQALARIEKIEGASFYGNLNLVVPKELVRGFVLDRLGRAAEASVAFARAIDELERRIAAAEQSPDIGEQAHLALALAGAGDESGALAMARHVDGQVASRPDAAGAPGALWALAQTFSVLDRPETARSYAQRVLSVESAFSSELLRLDPLFANLGSHDTDGQ